MILLKGITVLILITAAFLNAAALGEQVGLKRATKKTVLYRVALFSVDVLLAVHIVRL